MADEKAPQAVFTVVEGPNSPIWIRIGTAFECRDKSLNVLLNALPVNGKLHIREAKTSKNGQSA